MQHRIGRDGTVGLTKADLDKAFCSRESSQACQGQLKTYIRGDMNCKQSRLVDENMMPLKSNEAKEEELMR